MIPTTQICTRLHIISATYGPAEGRKLLDGKLVDYDKKETFIPYTRDALPFLRTLDSSSEGMDFEEGDFGENGMNNCQNGIELGSNSQQQTSTNSFTLMEGQPMNAVFGDPCPGTTKQLRVEYVFRDYFYHDRKVEFNKAEATITHRQNGLQQNGRIKRNVQCSRVFQSIFREHERVLLKRQDPLFRLQGQHLESDPNIVSNKMDADNEKMQVDHPPGMLPTRTSSSSSLPQIQTTSQQQTKSTSLSSPPSPARQWRLAPTTSEITLPIVLSFLTVRERAKCQLVCNSWRDIVLDRGIAVVVDVNESGLFPRSLMDFAPASSLSDRIPQSSSRTSLRSISSSNNSSTTALIENHPSRAILRGLLNHSYSSLESLVLNDYLPLQPIIDINPSLPHLRKLKRLDISRVPNITDETLELIAAHVGKRLEVLYMKGLSNITNNGVVNLAQSCINLRVLDLSQVHQLNDEAGLAIGQHLKKLEVIHMKDNYKLTNESVDLITRNCQHLVQVTFWGCIKLKNVSFDDVDKQTVNSGDTDGARTVSMSRPPSLDDLNAPSAKLVLLNLWGCHSLTDDAAVRLKNLPHLKSLCVSECHRLTDQFVSGICQSLPQLVHLQLRYCRRISDASLESISHSMQSLHSLDVSFCTKLTIGGLTQLFNERRTSLTELRLFSCRQLDIEGGTVGGRGIVGGRRLVHALKSVRESSTLSFLDLRSCQQHEPFSRDEIYLNGMAEIGFTEIMNGLFVRHFSARR